MKLLITGGTGFVAPFLVKELRESGFSLEVTAPEACTYDLPGGRIAARVADLTDLDQTKRLIKDVCPDAVCHLAAVSHVGRAWHDRGQLVNININATSNLCQSLAALDKQVTFLFASSGHVYAEALGREVPPDNRCSEDTLPSPKSPFGASKLAAEFVVRSFASERFKPYIVRPFNLIGPGQSPSYVAPAFARRIKMTSPGGQIAVGNLNAVRDFCDVRDMVRAYRLVLEIQPQESLFVLGSGERTTVGTLLSTLIQISGKIITPLVDTSLLRPSDPPEIVANPSLAYHVLGWQPRISLAETLADVYAEVK